MSAFQGKNKLLK